MDILPTATTGIQHNEHWRFQRFSPDHWLTAVRVPVASESQWVSLGVCVGVEVTLCVCVEIFFLRKSVIPKMEIAPRHSFVFRSCARMFQSGRVS